MDVGKEVYKVVAIRNLGCGEMSPTLESLLISEHADLRLRYRFGQKTVPVVGCLFAFETYEQADDFVLTKRDLGQMAVLRGISSKALPTKFLVTPDDYISIEGIRQGWSMQGLSRRAVNAEGGIVLGDGSYIPRPYQLSTLDNIIAGRRVVARIYPMPEGTVFCPDFTPLDVTDGGQYFNPEFIERLVKENSATDRS